jgi:hypothetical protein
MRFAQRDAPITGERTDRVTGFNGTTRPALLIVTLMMALFIVVAREAIATQHLVAAGEDWSLLDSRLKPGDEILLMPGTHRAVTLENARGTSDRPIVIRPADPAQPVTIEADRYGLRLLGPRHVQIADVIITGATIHGLSLEGKKTSAREAAAGEGESARCGSVTLRHVAVLDTGPRGLRHGVRIEQLDDVRILGCRVEGWAGSGIEIVACSDVLIEDCAFSGKEDFTQLSGVRLRAGSQGIRLNRCRFQASGDQGVCIGGESKMDEFARPPAADAEPESLFEAIEVEVLRCTFRDGLCAVGWSTAATRRCGSAPSSAPAVPW